MARSHEASMKVYEVDINEGHEFARPILPNGTEALLKKLESPSAAPSRDPEPVRIIHSDDDGKRRVGADVLLVGPISPLIALKASAMD